MKKRQCFDCFMQRVHRLGLRNAFEKIRDIPVLVKGCCPVYRSTRALGPETPEERPQTENDRDP